MSSRPNVILICLDQMRADCLGIAGHPVVQTPYVDQWASGGARFNRAYAACPSCVPARASLYTGLTHRTHRRVSYIDGVPWDYPETLGSEFSKHGYETLAIGKMHVYPVRNKIGFNRVILHDGYIHHTRKEFPRDPESVDDYLVWLRNELGRDADYFDHGLNCNSYVVRPWDKPEYTHPSNFVVTKALEFFKERDTAQPFFLYLSFHRPHSPLDPPAWALDQYLNQQLPEPPIGDWADTFAPYAKPHQSSLLSVGPLSPEQLHRAQAGYYGLITQIDHQINRLLETLDSFDLTKDTYVCFTSDHGEMLGDHNLFRKCVPYEGSARVPMILTGPPESGIKAQDIGHVPIELMDVLPTLLDCAGLPIPSSVEGKSFLPIARGESCDWREYLHGEHCGFGGSFHWITDGHAKYIWFSHSGEEQLFNLDDDPQELCNLSRKPGSEKELRRLRAVLISELRGRPEGFTDGQQLIAGCPVTNYLPPEKA